jgi:hypothetical protein
MGGAPLRLVVIRGVEGLTRPQLAAGHQGPVPPGYGAAAILGVPASTLESKIKRFRIDKLRYRAAHQ